MSFRLVRAKQKAQNPKKENIMNNIKSIISSNPGITVSDLKALLKDMSEVHEHDVYFREDPACAGYVYRYINDIEKAFAAGVQQIDEEYDNMCLSEFMNIEEKFPVSHAIIEDEKYWEFGGLGINMSMRDALDVQDFWEEEWTHEF